MKLDANDPLLGTQPETFLSPFPSNDALLSDKFAAFLQGLTSTSPGAETVGTRIMAQAQAQAWRSAQAMCNKAKATVVGDLPSAWLPEVAFFHEVRPGVDALGGLWAQVAFPHDTSDPEAFTLAVADVGLDAALTFLNAAPIVGPLMKWILNLGGFLGRLFVSPATEEVKRRLLPWAEYKLGTDQDFVQKGLIEQFFSGVDWTGIFLPPYEAVPWTLADGYSEGRYVGQLWAPAKGKHIAYSTSIGAMPGTFRLAGHVQSPKPPEQADPRLLRYFSDGTMLHWGRALTDTGEFYPATAQTSTLAWQQAQRDGSPDMYKVDCTALEHAWAEYFDQFFDSLWHAFKSDEWIGEFAAPYLAVQGAELRLGLRDPSRPDSPKLQRPHPAPLITPTIFKSGAGTPATRNDCLYLESVEGPYGKGQGRDGTRGTSTSSGGTLAVAYTRDDAGRVLASGGPAWPKNKKMPKGSMCIPWPSGEELLVKYQRPDTAFILPAVRRLRERQRWCLRHTLVCAYVRPDGPNAYAAFAADPELAALCRDMRQKLLQDEARFAVRLVDVHDIDPAFEQQLRTAGVTNSLAQSQQLLGLKAKAEAAAELAADPPPPPVPPAGGLPFDIPPPVRVPRPSPGKGNRFAAAAGLGAAALVGYKLLR